MRKRRHNSKKLSIQTSHYFYETVVINTKFPMISTPSYLLLERTLDPETHFIMKNGLNKTSFNHTFLDKYDTDPDKRYYTTNENNIYVIIHNVEANKYKIVSGRNSSKYK